MTDSSMQDLDEALTDLQKAARRSEPLKQVAICQGIRELFKQQRQNSAWTALINRRGLSDFAEYTMPCPGGEQHTDHCRGQIQAFLKGHGYEVTP